MGKITIGITLLMICFACSAGYEMPGPADRIEFLASVADVSFPCREAGTRTGMSGSRASFVSGDRIGISETLTGYSNVPCTFNGTTWSTANTMYWHNGTSVHTFYAYYPYNVNSTGTAAVVPLLNGQTVSASAQAPDAACDMLVAGPRTQARTAGTNVPLAFTHAFSLLQFNIRLGSLLNLYVLNNITLQGGNQTGTSKPYGIVNTTNDPALIHYDLSTRTIRDYGNTTAVYATSLSRDFASFSLLTSVTSFYFLIFPGTYVNPAPTVRLTTALAGLISVGKNAALPQNTFAPNTKYTYDIRIGGILSAEASIRVTLVSQEPLCNETFPNEQP